MRALSVGDFRDELVAYLLGQPDKKVTLTLPLAAMRDGTARLPVNAEVGIHSIRHVYVKDLDKESYHTSMSQLRSNYMDQGGGSKTWARFQDAKERSIADLIGVDAEKATEDR